MIGNNAYLIIKKGNLFEKGSIVPFDVPYHLQDGDEVNLAHGEVLFMFY